MEKIKLNNDLGNFEGFNFRSQSAICKPLTAEEVVNWDHDARGEAEFWASGDHEGVFAVFKGQSAVTFSELQKLDELITELGDEPETYVKIAWFQAQGYNFQELTPYQIEDETLYVARGNNFIDLEKDTAYELFETFFPEEYAVWEKSMCPGLSFDPKRFLSGPEFETMEITIGNEKFLIIQPL